ncbi:NAD(P)/FAD-dependent oxidoreductase [Microbacterium sp. SSM24]|uniref:NAD(P)/FAD-dependent oxidoreductase n=1 Tax=Microbacterium sp. SSM24 TaxID=2991714 RepID=UPI0022263F06|nr:FAD-dependent oxidoreductase [Microbacterium sp. SSM24]MCW3493346.1 FAD-dependent oxidoreductase [Microbacterium sp. SSM24]
MESHPRHHRILIIGGGNGGLSIAGRLRRGGVTDIAVVEPRDDHVFAPFQSHIAGGLVRASQAVRRQADVTPRGVAWIRDRVVEVDPAAQTVVLGSGEAVEYEHLVVAVGLETRYDSVPGLAEAMQRPDGVSSYTFELAAKASPALRDLRTGTVIFVQQPEPASAAGVAQKPMYLACDWWRRIGRLSDIRVVFVTPEPSAFPVPAISDELQRKLDEYGVETRFGADLREVRPERNEIVVERGAETEVIAYDLLHAAPPQSPPDWIAASGLADDDDPHGFVAVDPSTLRSQSFANVWALGDAASVDTLRSGGAIRTQAKILTRNLLAVLAGDQPAARYDGYTVCPITVSRHTVVFAEFDRDLRLAPTVPGWKTLYRERRFSFVLDRYVLPWVYWHLILQGRA